MIKKCALFNELCLHFPQDFKKEMKFRLSSSLMLFIYYLICLLVSLPTILLPSTVQFRGEILYILILLFVLFSSFSSDIFSREIQNNMSEFLLANLVGFRRTFYTRLVTNFILISSPIYIILFFYDFLYLRFILSLNTFFSFISCIFLLYFWFLLSMMIFLLLDILFKNAILRIIIYFQIIGFIIIILSIFSNFIYPFKTILGYNLFYDPIFSLLVTITPILLFQKLFSSLLSFRLKRFRQKSDNMKRNQFSNNKIKFIHTAGKYVKKLINSTKIISKRSRLLKIALLLIMYLIAMMFNIIYIILYVHVLITFIYLLLFVLPSVIAEKQFNMEEMILAVITTEEYYIKKLKLLLYPSILSLSPIILVLVIVGILCVFLANFYAFSVILLFLIFTIAHIFYLVSIILLNWRMLPMKNLYQNSLISIIFLDLLINALSYFFTKGGTVSPATMIAPISSLAMISSFKLEFNAQYPLIQSVFTTLMLSTLMILISYSLTRESRFE